MGFPGEAGPEAGPEAEAEAEPEAEVENCEYFPRSLKKKWK
jgi:hypothetical protein